ncbi:hypothetical protein [Clostridium algidicarnis]|uniref:hypothetical protein n=1 Tax=Clostridium algidicarnis TaxID=37659 RepID=UPI000494EDF3|nr:hypothetical protein [Clostridium algidicarnis]
MNKVYLNKTHLNILKTFFNKNLTYEKFAIVLFDINTYEKETNFNIKYIITPPPKAIIESNDFIIRVDPRFYKYYIRYSKEKKLGFILAHNHPGGIMSDFSISDKCTEEKIIKLLLINNEIKYHGSMVFNLDTFKIRILWNNELSTINEFIIKDDYQYFHLEKVEDQYKYR